MKKKIAFLTLGAALLAAPVLAAPGAGLKPDDNATLTRADAQAKATQLFAKLDANKDGKLDASDRAAKRAEMQAKAFERLDANKDGSISKAEWDQHAADRAAKRSERGDKRAEAGKRGDGPRHAMRGHRGGPGGPHGMMLGRADANGDKAITQAEFQTAALARFDAADANKDGQVTPDERAAQRAAWKAKADEWRAKRAAPPAGE